MSKVAKVRYRDYRSSIAEALDLIGAGEGLPDDGLIVIKPNLINADGPPVTTPVEATEAVYLYCKEHCAAEIVIGEGCGSGLTEDTYRANGYTKLAKDHGIRLIDFNTAEATLVRDERAFVLSEFYIPEIVRDAFVVSVPILKDHSFTQTTIAMKNMFGIAPGRYYSGGWNKSKLHSPSTHKSVVDVCLYKKPDLCVVDAVVALEGMHLSGTAKRLDTILASFDPVAVDAIGSEMLGHVPGRIEYLQLADGLIGSMEGIEVVTG